MTKETRRKRALRDVSRSSRATGRDIEILESLGRLRFATTAQLARVHFGGSRSATNKRMRKLLDRGLLRVWVRDLAKDNIYALAPRGAGELKGEEGAFCPLPRGLDGNLDHLLCINDVRIILALSLGEATGEIAWWRSDWDLRGIGKVGTVPDALFAIRWREEGEQAFALEVDNQSRSQRAFLRKLLGYYAVVSSPGTGVCGIRDFVLLTVCTEEEWVDRYLAVARDSKIDLPIWLAPLSSFEEEGIDGSIWRAAESDEKYSLRSLATLPCGKEGRAPSSVDELSS